MNYRLVLALLCAAVVTATSASAAPDPIELPVLLPLTGYGAFFGVPQVQALRGIESYINKTGGIQGRPVHFIVKDDATNPQLDIQLANEIFTLKLPVMLGPDTAGQCNAVTPMVATKGPVTFCFTTSVHPPPGSFVFGTGPRSEYMSDAIFTYLAKRGLKKIAILTTTDASGQDGDRMLVESSTRDKSIEIVDRQFFGVSDVSVAAQVAHMKGSGAQAVVVWCTGTPFGTALRAIQDSGMDLPIVASSANILYGELKQYEALMPRELLFPSQAYLAPETITDKGVRDAVRTLTTELAAFGAKPDQGQNSDWDGVMLVMTALRKVGINATPEQLRSYIAGLRSWAGIDGRYDFVSEPQRGLDRSTVIMVRWDAKAGTFRGASKPGGQPI